MSRERDIFEMAVEIAHPAERDAYLAKACNGNAAMRERVDDLLEFEREDHSFLSEQQFVSASPRTESLIGTQIDRYKLLEEIGEGGCGIVYMAEQREPVRRKVALKIIKPGMDTREVIARFDAERQALAMMDHPHIARVLDGGETKQGRPYFVMELVNGVPITEYCDANRLTPEKRLELFVKVCHAVQHAHQKGIIHRDIKPSNVLVTLHDGEAVPRVIDFGVAKAIGQHLTENTLFTHFGQIVGTPQYMSPEQAERSGLDVDTRSDIYSLGVLLYEMLTGQTPLDKVRLRQVAFDELLRVVREEETKTPSARISTLGEEGTIICESRSTEAQRLQRMLRGDLDWIVMKALEKDRSRRFATANDLAADIQRHLKNEPVLSGPPSRAYRLTKFVRRNRASVLASAAVIGALAAGFVVALFGLSRANAERNNAIASAAEAQTVLTMLHDMLATDPDIGRGRSLTVRKMLDDFSAGLPPMTDQPKIAAAIHGILGDAYLGLNYENNALVHLHRSYKLKSQLYGRQHIEVAYAAQQIFRAYAVLNDRPKAYKYGQIAVSTYDALDDYSEKSLSARRLFSSALLSLGESTRAEDMLRDAIDAAQSRGVRNKMYRLQASLSYVLVRRGELDEAMQNARQSFEYFSQNPSSDDSDVARSHSNLGYCLAATGRLEEAADHYEQALSLLRPPNDELTLGVKSASSKLFCVYAMLFRYDDAATGFEDSLQSADNDWYQVANFNDLVLLELNQGKYKDAEPRCHEMRKRPGDGADVTMPRVVAGFLLAFSTRRHDPELSREVCDEMWSEAQKLAAHRPGTFSSTCAWMLLHKSKRTENDIKKAVQLAKNGVKTSSLNPTMREVYLIAWTHHVLAQAYLADGNGAAALEQQKLAVDKMPKYQLFLSGEVERAYVSQLLEQADPKIDVRQFLRDAVTWRQELELVRDQILTADARMNLAAHLIEYSTGEQDLKEAEELLAQDDHVMKSRDADDLFRTRWFELRSQLENVRKRSGEPARNAGPPCGNDQPRKDYGDTRC